MLRDIRVTENKFILKITDANLLQISAAVEAMVVSPSQGSQGKRKVLDHYESMAVVVPANLLGCTPVVLCNYAQGRRLKGRYLISFNEMDHCVAEPTRILQIIWPGY
jgi:hypothetical protein